MKMKSAPRKLYAIARFRLFSVFSPSDGQLGENSKFKVLERHFVVFLVFRWFWMW